MGDLICKKDAEFSYFVLAIGDSGGGHTENSTDILSTHPAKWSQDWPKSLTGKINSNGRKEFAEMKSHIFRGVSWVSWATGAEKL